MGKRVITLLIIFEVIEWHQPDHVMQRFGMQQSAPRYGFDRWGRFSTTDWSVQHASLIALWNSDIDMSSREYHLSVDRCQKTMPKDIDDFSLIHSATIQIVSFHPTLFMHEIMCKTLSLMLVCLTMAYCIISRV